MSIMFPCAQCGQRYQVDESLTGKRMKCKKCDAVMRIPASTPPASNPTAPPRPPLQTFGAVTPPAPTPPRPAPRRPAPPAADRFTIDDVEDPYGLDSAPTPSHSVSSKPLDDWDDELLPARATIARAKPSSSKSNRSRSDGDVMDAVSKWITIAGCGALGLFILLALIGTFVISHKSIMILAMIAFVVSVLVAVVLIAIGGIWSLVVPFMESAVCGLMYLFVPFYGLYYLVTRWDEMRRPFLVNLAGVGLLVVASFTSALALPALQKARGNNPAFGPQADAFAPPRGQPGQVRPPQIRPGMSPEERQAEFDRFRNELQEQAQDHRRPNRRRPSARQPNPPGSADPNASLSPPAAATTPAPPPQVARVEPRARFRPGGGQTVATPAAGEGLALAGWRVQPDPAPEPVSFPAGPPLKIPIPEGSGNEDVLYPSTPSPFIALGGNGDEHKRREVWDLRDGKRVGGLIGRLDLNRPLALSPDGKYLVGHANKVPRVTAIWSTTDGKLVGEIEDGKNIPDVIDFAGPSRVVIATTHAKEFHVWDFQTGAEAVVFQVPENYTRESVAFSPGRRYIAFATDRDGGRMWIYDLTDGSLAGETDLPRNGKPFGLNCKALAFSPDGKELAGLFERPLDGWHLLVWDLTNGKLLANHVGTGTDPFGRKRFYEGHPLQWLPDQTGWLAFDEAIVERQSGQRVWSLPFDRDQGMEEAPRKVIDADRALAVVRTGDRKMLCTVPLLKEKMQAAINLAKAGGKAIDALLPPLKASDRASAKRIAAPSDAVSWSAKADPAPSGKPLSRTPIPLNVRDNEVNQVLFARPDVAQAVLQIIPGGKTFRPEDSREGTAPHPIERYDLIKGTRLGKFDVPAVSSLIAVSPDGGRVLLNDAKGGDRLDVIGTDGNHVVGWRPYDQDSGDDQTVLWADFLDPDRVLTVNKAGTLILWSIPDCKAVYIMAGACQGTPVLSPGRAFLAAFGRDTLSIIDPVTGAIQGRETIPSTPTPNLAGLKAAAFRHDGQELAALVNGLIVRWNMATGQALTDFPLPMPQAAALEYAGPTFLLVDNRTLVDLKHGWIVWKYAGGIHARGSPDGAHWFVSPGAPASLAAIDLPDKKAAALLASAFDPKTKGLLGQGAKVTIQIDGTPPRYADAFQRYIKDGLSTRLAALGASAANGQKVRLVVTFREKDTGQTVQLRELGRGRGTKQIALRTLDGDIALNDDQGPPLVIARVSSAMKSFGITHLPPGETDPEGFLRQQMWDHVRDQMSGALPIYVARGPAGPIILPGQTNLNAPGG